MMIIFWSINKTSNQIYNHKSNKNNDKMWVKNQKKNESSFLL